MNTEQPVIPEDLQTWYSVACDKVHFATDYDAIKTLIERIARLTSDLAEVREDASQNTDRYLACEKRFEEAIAQRDAANLRVEGLEKARELERLQSAIDEEGAQ